MGLYDTLMDYLASKRNCRPGVSHTCNPSAGVAHTCNPPAVHSGSCSYGVCGSIEPGLEARLNRNRRIDQILMDEAFVRKNRPDLAPATSDDQSNQTAPPPAKGSRPVGLLSRMKDDLDALAKILE